MERVMWVMTWVIQQQRRHKPCLPLYNDTIEYRMYYLWKVTMDQKYDDNSPYLTMHFTPDDSWRCEAGHSVQRRPDGGVKDIIMMIHPSSAMSLVGTFADLLADNKTN